MSSILGLTSIRTTHNIHAAIAPRGPTVTEKKIPRDRIRFIRFCVVGVSGVVVNLGFFTLAHAVLAPRWPDTANAFVIANLIGFLISVFTNFLLNDFWTWGDREKRGHGHFWARLSKFYLVSSVAGGVQLGVASLCHVRFGVHEHASVLIGIGVATAINYVANNIWTFRDSSKKPSQEL